jgi:TonB-linked SusC/RagA family outer membrane protein
MKHSRREFLLLLFSILFIVITNGQSRLIQGRVTIAKDNEPAIGTTILLEGSSNGTVADVEGKYSITVPQSGGVLRFSMVGFISQSISVDPVVNTLDVIMTEDAVIINEVVVTALGIKKEKAKLGYATQEISAEPLKKAAEANVASNLTGKIAGLQISNKTTLYENPEILLRGEKTLVVIDGVPTQTDFWNINSNDIDNITVLKGTAAAALYGSLGINGAIMITTKKGKDGKDGVELSLNSTTQFQAGYIRIPTIQTQYGMGWNGQYSFVDGKGGGIFDDYGYVYGPKLNVKDPSTKSGFVEIPQYNSSIDPATGQRIPLPWITRGQNNLQNFLRNQLLTTTNFSLAGKSDKGDYRLSVSHLYQKGQVPNTRLNSTTASLSAGLKLTSKIRAEGSMSYNRQYSPNYPSAGYGADNYFYNILLWMGTDVDLRDMKDYWIPGKEGTLQKTYNYTWYNNPWYLANEYIKKYTNDVILGNVNLTWDFTKDLKFLVRSGITTNNVFTDRKTPYSFIYYGTGASPLGNYSLEKENNFQIISDAMLTYNKSFLKDWDITASAGASHRFNGNDLTSSRTTGLNIPGYYNLSNSISPVQTSNRLIEKEVSSLYGYVDLGYKHMIYLGMTGRNDWTSTLQKPYNSFFYPSATLGLIVSEMTSFPDWFTYLKFRGSWANVSTDTDPYYTIPSYDNYIRWNGNLSLRRPEALITPDIRPNKTISKEIGTELKFFQNKLGIDLTYFNYNQNNFIVEAPISQASGFNSKLVNGGEIIRKGWELAVYTNPIKQKDLSWDVTANLSQAHRYRKSFYDGAEEQDGVRVGGRADVLRGWGWQRSPEGKIVTIDGRPQYIDHVINLGTSDPDWIFGLGNKVTWKGISLNVLIDGRIGGYLINGVEAKLYEGGTHPATANSFRDDSYTGKATYLLDGVEVTDGTAQWDQQGNITADTRKFKANDKKVKYIDYLFDTYVNGIDQSVLYDRSFVKLREITISFALPDKLMKKLPFTDANFSLVGRNLALWSKVPFMDPDGYNYYSLAEPSYRNIGVNINLKF